MKRETVEKANQIIKKIDKMKEAYEPVKSFLDFMDNEEEKTWNIDKFDRCKKHIFKLLQVIWN